MVCSKCGAGQHEYYTRRQSVINAWNKSAYKIDIKSVRRCRLIETSHDYYKMMNETDVPDDIVPYFTEGESVACSCCGTMTDIPEAGIESWGWCPFCGAIVDSKL